MRTLRVTLVVLGISQIAFGAVFLKPGLMATMVHLQPPEPDWADWLMATAGARYVGYGIGMFVAARRPRHNVLWIDTMIGIQLVDWLAVLGYISFGVLPLDRVIVAVISPPVYIAGLAWGRWRAHLTAAAPASIDNRW